jgi:PAS domain S-box-containing protein
VRGDVIGVLDIQSSEAVSLDEGDIAVLQTMADQLVIALENARLFEETQMRVQELSMLFEVSRSLAGAPLQPREICAAVARQFIEVLGIQECGIHLLADRQGDAMWILFEEGVFRWEGEGGAEVYSLSKYPATARVVETRLPLVVQASDPEPPAAERAYMEKYGLATLAIIPMSVKGQAIGTIELSTWGEERHYTPVELNLAITLANQAAAALENARLFRAVEEKQRYLRTVLDSVNHAMVVTDLEGRVHLANRAMEVLLGISEGEAIDQPLAEVGGEALSDVAERITVGEVAGPEALQMELSDGRALVAHLTPITDPQGEHVGYVVAMADVSALHRLNQLKSRVIRIASHDLRNPLHLAAGFFKILLDDLPLLTAQQSALAQRVLNHLDAMERLVDNLLELERVEVAGADQLERLDMGVVVQKVLRDQCLQVELKQHFLWSEIAEDLPMVRGERVMLAQAVSNLVDNAVKYTQEGGEISVRVWAEGDEVLVTVQDNGPGIPPEDQSRVFDQFYRGHQPGTEHVPGSGLGLSLVQAIAQQHRGRVWVESEGTPGSGSTFGIALPVD